MKYINHNKKTRLKKEGGFSLVEVIIAISVVALIAMVAFPFFANGITTTSSNATKTSAIARVNESIEAVRANPTCSNLEQQKKTPIEQNDGRDNSFKIVITSDDECIPGEAVEVTSKATRLSDETELASISSKVFIPQDEIQIPANENPVIVEPTDPTEVVPTMAFSYRCEEPQYEGEWMWGADSEDDKPYIALPVYDFTGEVIWSDGTSSTQAGGPIERKYVEPNEPISVTLKGKVENMGGMGYVQAGCLRSVDIWDASNETKSVSGAFSGAKNLTSVATPPATITDTSYMFSSAVKFDQDVSDWDTSNVTNMTGMFSVAMEFNHPLNSWDTSNVESMNYMFGSAEKFNQDLDNWNTSKVTNTESMFDNAHNFNGKIGNWDMSKVTNISSMFDNARSFNQPIGNWDISSASVIDGVFSGARDFNQPLNDWDIASGGGEQISSMFSNAVSFNQPLDKWDTSNIKQTFSMFNGALAFNQDLDTWNMSNVDNVSNMFNNAPAFNGKIGNWDTSKVQYMGGMFNYALSFNQPLNDWDTSSVVELNSTFSRAVSFNQPLNNWNTSNVEQMFTVFNGATAFNQQLNNWDTSKVMYMHSMFGDAKSFNQNISNWNVDNVTDGSYFRYGSALSTPNTPAKFR